MKRKLHNEKGFTLIELMATLAILALIVLIAVPAIGSIISNADDSAEANSIAMIERAGALADVGGLEHDIVEQYSVTSLIDNGYLDMDESDALVSGYVEREGDSGNTYVYNGDSVAGEEQEEVATDPSMFTYNRATIDDDSNMAYDIPNDVLGVTGFSDQRPESLVDIVIPETYNGLPVVWIYGDAFASENLKSVVLHDNLFEIGSGAFSDNDLTSVTLYEPLYLIGGDAFANNNLTSIVVPSTVGYILSSPFDGNEGLVVYGSYDSYNQTMRHFDRKLEDGQSFVLIDE